MSFAVQLEEGRKDPWQIRLNRIVTLGQVSPQRHRGRRTEKKERGIDLYGFLSVPLWLCANSEEEMSEIEKLREQLPDAARDIRLNLQTVFQSASLTPAQTWGAALASAIATRNGELARAVFAEAQSNVDANVIEDARAAAALMAMNNVYYRFRHLVGKESYATKPARLRMNWIGKR